MTKKPRKTEKPETGTGTAAGGKKSFKVDKSVGTDQPRGGYKPAKSARPGTAPSGRGGASSGGNGGAGNGNTGTGTTGTNGGAGSRS